MSQIKPFAILGVLLAVGLLGAGFFVSKTLYNARAASNTVTVRGLAERDVKADLALWDITFQTAGSELAATTESARKRTADVKAYLTSKGLDESSLTTGAISVQDNMANQYTNTAINPQTRYIITSTISVRSADVEKIDIASKTMDELLAKDVLLTGSGLRYEYTKLNDIKPEMLKEATQNARSAAQQFANDSGNSVGRMQSANQGFFSIKSRDASTSSDQENYENKSTIEKKVRVVISATYYLD
jgi:uncharacterized protein